MNRSLLAFPLASLLVALPGCDWLGKLRGDGAPAGAGSASAGASASAAPGLPASFAAMPVPAGVPMRSPRAIMPRAVRIPTKVVERVSASPFRPGVPRAK